MCVDYFQRHRVTRSPRDLPVPEPELCLEAWLSYGWAGPFPRTLVGVGAVGAEGGAHAVHAYPLALGRALGAAAAAPQQLQLALQVPLLALQGLQLVLALPVRLFKFLLGERRRRRRRSETPVQLSSVCACRYEPEAGAAAARSDLVTSGRHRQPA